MSCSRLLIYRTDNIFLSSSKLESIKEATKATSLRLLKLGHELLEAGILSQRFQVGICPYDLILLISRLQARVQGQ